MASPAPDPRAARAIARRSSITIARTRWPPSSPARAVSTRSGGTSSGRSAVPCPARWSSTLPRIGARGALGETQAGDSFSSLVRRRSEEPARTAGSRRCGGRRGGLQPTCRLLPPSSGPARRRPGRSRRRHRPGMRQLAGPPGRASRRSPAASPPGPAFIGRDQPPVHSVWLRSRADASHRRNTALTEIESAAPETFNANWRHGSCGDEFQALHGLHPCSRPSQPGGPYADYSSHALVRRPG